MSQKKRSGERRQGAPDEPARPASRPAEEEPAGADGDGRPPAGEEVPPSETQPAETASTDGEPSVEDAAGGEPGEADQATVAGERDEYLALAQRTKADFENYRKRATRELAAAGVRGKAELVRELLPVVDNLERALESADESEAGLADGVRLVLSELTAALERNGVRAIQPVGEPFDPNLHEALSTRAENGAEAGLVLDVIQKGYRLDRTVLRPARVVVSA